MLKKIKTNVMSVLMAVKMTNKPCTECNRFLNEHSDDELAECALNIIKDMKKDLEQDI